MLLPLLPSLIHPRHGAHMILLPLRLGIRSVVVVASIMLRFLNIAVLGVGMVVGMVVGMMRVVRLDGRLARRADEGGEERVGVVVFYAAAGGVGGCCC